MLVIVVTPGRVLLVGEEPDEEELGGAGPTELLVLEAPPPVSGEVGVEPGVEREPSEVADAGGEEGCPCVGVVLEVGGTGGVR